MSPCGVDWNRQGPPTIFYVLVFHENQPPLKTFITVDGVYKYSKQHERDKKQGFDWGPYDIYAVSTEGPAIVKTTVNTLVEEQGENIRLEIKARLKRFGEK